MNQDLFDRRLRAIRRDRAARIGPELFLHDRAFDDCLDRLRDIPRRFERALLLGCLSPGWRSQVETIATEVEVLDPGGQFASLSGGRMIEEDRHDFGDQVFDLCITCGTLETVNELPLALQRLHRGLRPDSPIIGAIVGGDSLPSLRTSLMEAGRAKGRVVARTHPRIAAPTLAQLLLSAGFTMPVVDIDRVKIGYPSFTALIRDLRAMGATSVLAQRPPPLSRSDAIAASAEFQKLGNGGRTEEIMEILHFLAWKQ